MKLVLSMLVLQSGLAFANTGDPYQSRCNTGYFLGGNHCGFACPQMCDSDANITSRGTFVSVGQHQVKGTIMIEKHSIIGNYLALETDFQTDPGPDLRIVLRDSTGVNSPITVATLDQTNGTTGKQKYSIGAVDGYDEAVIYCAQYQVDFGVAKLEKQ